MALLNFLNNESIPREALDQISAPSFKLPDQNGEMVELDDFYGKKHVVVFFYPKNYTPICTLEAIAFRDYYEEFVKAGCEVIGISSDPTQSHQHFCQYLNLNFRLLSDKNNAVRNAFNSAIGFEKKHSRVTFVIDKMGIIRFHFCSAMSARKHAMKALEVLTEDTI